MLNKILTLILPHLFKLYKYLCYNNILLIILFFQRVYDSNIWKFIPLARLKLAALNHSANSLFFLILQWLEHWTYPYQEYTLPVKLKNLNLKDLYSKKVVADKHIITFLNLDYKNFSCFRWDCHTEKRWFEHPGVNYTIFSKYLTLPIATFPLNELDRWRSGILFLDKKRLYQLSY